MTDGRQLVAKVPNPNAGFPFYKTASEVATMEFARAIAGIPMSQVHHAWSNRADADADDNAVGAEYY
ncbi:hypothetical protein BO70DRAFT_399593 [Aspergillus heteromorphus CBS 117.55]|uniref:Aminoglycoside phosphotransferase domain-containing protein n=1 Tax=Aspergillus heteromorphus CBS 117.55 TaxID=1448321 RepID=A0A317VD90_9EURO|nr:uncharacterized protein BO70DRAFT_399593 [Aspergillus heteromorphus CBS 117.55]PWY70977.1 hypothetical protein BO70DRAFT_399593 [Aspergillus heteromorphus CBS 117.55]